ncbi:metalloprotease [Nanoarchaeota archaeon]
MYGNSVRPSSFSFSKHELLELLKAWVGVTIVFSIFLSSALDIQTSVIVSVISVGLGVIVHELAHKLVAQHYGCFAEFRSFPVFLLLSIGLAFLGVVAIAPGAVFISGPLGVRRNGVISAVGPFSNLLLALIFLGISFIPLQSELLHAIIVYGFKINGWLALFNLIPFGPLDGKKIFNWNKIIYGAMVVLSFVLVFAL